MSFSHNAKKEVALSELPANECCKTAELSGLVRTCTKISSDFSINFVTELQEVATRIKMLIAQLFEYKDLQINKLERPGATTRYSICLTKEQGKRVLDGCYMFRANYDGTNTLNYAISRHLIENECCQQAFIKGVFMGCASANIVIKDINDLKKHTGGYHLEFAFTNSTLAGDFAHVLSQYEIYSKTMQRKKMTVVYLKEAEIVSDVLALVGANEAVLTLQNEFAVREVRNQLNRQLNCMNSNMGKMIDASLKQIEAIQYISNTVGLESLPENLYELCMLRLANPEETLENLAKLMSPPLTKSGINHRLRKIVKYAEELKQNNED